MKQVLNVIAVLMLSGLLAACSATAKTEIAKPKSETISSRSIVALEVVPGAGQETDEDSEAVIQKLRSSLFGGLVANGLFKQVVHASEPADYTMKVTVDGIRTVSQGARIFLGVLAGENQFKAHCQVKNATTGGEVTTFTVAGESAAHPLSSENDMDDAINKVVEKIVAALH